jgi:hypothetical protein
MQPGAKRRGISHSGGFTSAGSPGVASVSPVLGFENFTSSLDRPTCQCVCKNVRRAQCQEFLASLSPGTPRKREKVSSRGQDTRQPASVRQEKSLAEPRQNGRKPNLGPSQLRIRTTTVLSCYVTCRRNTSSIYYAAQRLHAYLRSMSNWGSRNCSQKWSPASAVPVFVGPYKGETSSRSSNSVCLAVCRYICSHLPGAISLATVAA